MSRPTEGRHERADEDDHVQPGRPVLDVLVVEAGALEDRCVPVQAVDLSPAGHPGPHPAPVTVPGHLAAKLLGEVPTLWPGPDQAHLPAPHIPYPRQLVQVSY